MYCPQCGVQNPDAVTVCSQCGADMQALLRQYADFERPPKPNNYLVLSIVGTIIGCVPLGVPAIVFSAQVDNRYAAGDYEGAARYSRTARILAWVSISIGILISLMYIAGAIIGAFAEHPSGG